MTNRTPLMTRNAAAGGPMPYAASMPFQPIGGIGPGPHAPSRQPLVELSSVTG